MIISLQPRTHFGPCMATKWSHWRYPEFWGSTHGYQMNSLEVPWVLRVHAWLLNELTGGTLSPEGPRMATKWTHWRYPESWGKHPYWGGSASGGVGAGQVGVGWSRPRVRPTRHWPEGDSSGPTWVWPADRCVRVVCVVSSVVCVVCVCGVWVVCVWYVCGMCVVCVWYVCVWCVCGMCVVCEWYVCGMCVVCVWCVCGMCVVCV